MSAFAMQLASLGSAPSTESTPTGSEQAAITEDGQSFEDTLHDVDAQRAQEHAQKQRLTKDEQQPSAETIRKEHESAQRKDGSDAHKDVQGGEHTQAQRAQQDPKGQARQAEQGGQRVAVDGNGEPGRSGEMPRVSTNGELQQGQNTPQMEQPGRVGGQEPQFGRVMDQLQNQAAEQAEKGMDKIQTQAKDGMALIKGDKGESLKAQRAVSQTPVRAQSPQFGDQLANRIGRMKLISQPGQQEQIRLRLEPRELGSLDIKLQVDADKQVHLTITAESESAKDALNRNMSQLREALAKQDLGFAELNVEVGERDFADAQSQGAFEDPSGKDQEGGDERSPWQREWDLVEEIIQSGQIRGPGVVGPGLSVIA
ncbi:flagellar hook-length control protein FliK [Magnetococcus sp. PR-3]|uniref:flagellar hook-length control protein FliK n=1 Tax=Magnetococcus sp. PR-3 TaxID=3120355 RepID=UPI002FCE1FB8